MTRSMFRSSASAVGQPRLSHAVHTQSRHRHSSSTSPPARARARTILSIDEDEAAELKKEREKERLRERERENAREREQNKALLEALGAGAVEDCDDGGKMHLFGEIAYSYSSDVHDADAPFQVMYDNVRVYSYECVEQVRIH